MSFISEPTWLVLVLVALVRGHISSACVTIYLHRAQTHGALKLCPAVEHTCRFLLWLLTGTVTAEWVAVHTYHHAHVETTLDPHSPQQRGILAVLLGGVPLYRKAASNRGLVARYAPNAPKDQIEQQLYSRHRMAGILLLLVTDLAIFGLWGLAIWGVQMLWIPFWAAGVINGLGHWLGYRNFETRDASRNITPLAVFIGAIFTAGEEWHNNHHWDQPAAKFSRRWWEVDAGWGYARLLEFLGLACDVRRPSRKSASG